MMAKKKPFSFLQFISTLAVAIIAVSMFCVLVGCSQKQPSQAEIDVYMKARDLYFQGSIKEAKSTLDTVSKSFGYFHQAQMLEAKLLFFGNDFDGAKKALTTLTKHYPGYEEAEIWLVRTLLAKNDIEGALATLEKMLEFNPGDPRLLILAGDAKLAAKDIQSALSFYSRAEEYGEEYSRALIEIARIYYRFSLKDKALGELHKASALIGPKSAMLRPLAELTKAVEGNLE